MAEERLSNSLKVHRAVRNLTQADLAGRIGTTRKSINAIEAGRMVPSTFLALKLARALDLPVESIFELRAD
jgi:putative transcriptional regulator